MKKLDELKNHVKIPVDILDFKQYNDFYICGKYRIIRKKDIWVLYYVNNVSFTEKSNFIELAKSEDFDELRFEAQKHYERKEYLEGNKCVTINNKNKVLKRGGYIEEHKKLHDEAEGELITFGTKKMIKKL